MDLSRELVLITIWHVPMFPSFPCFHSFPRYTFEMAPVFSLMEAEVLKKLREMIGWSGGEGIFSPGGSISNLYGLMAARFHKFPETKTKGVMGLPQMVLFGSQQVYMH